ncbi:diverse immunoglobulin domain-containing protein 2.1 [Polyodon spathula]|uniref:diverse immunoglobulin domain-containing protein 2.1 n=1 Tax=Polyodon spathula TaxID=7913 RepID=UPI001B7F0355|nr:diverse immunoglobulin domain-containing protein 2.1 [Polyodon spathula]
MLRFFILLIGIALFCDVSRSSAEEHVFAGVGSRALLPCFKTPLPHGVNRGTTVHWFKIFSKSVERTVWRSEKSGLEFWSSLTSKRMKAHQPRFHSGDFSLAVEDMRMSDAGRYRCAVNYERKNFQRFLHLHVMQVSPATAGPFIEGSSLTLQCSASDWPQGAKVSWLQNGIVLQSSRKQQIRERSLDIKDLDREDSGNWTCQVSYLGRTARVSYTLEVLGISSPSSSGSMVYGSLGLPATLPCVFSAGLSPSHTGWQRKADSSTVPGSRAAPSGRNASLLIPSVEFSHGGVYTCSGSVNGKRIERSVRLVVAAVSVKPSGLVSEGKSVSMTCTLSDYSQVDRFEWTKVTTDSNQTDPTDAPEQAPLLTSNQAKLGGLNFDRTFLIPRVSEQHAGEWICSLYSKGSLVGQIPFQLHITGQLQGSAPAQSSNKVAAVTLLSFLFVVLLLIALLMYRYQRKRARRNLHFPGLEAIQTEQSKKSRREKKSEEALKEDGP